MEGSYTLLTCTPLKQRNFVVRSTNMYQHNPNVYSGPESNPKNYSNVGAFFFQLKERRFSPTSFANTG
jgi:hypothetical protein